MKHPRYVNKSTKSSGKKKTLSLDGEKLMPAVGAECCFIHESLIFSKKIWAVNFKIPIRNLDKNNNTKLLTNSMIDYSLQTQKWVPSTNNMFDKTMDEWVCLNIILGLKPRLKWKCKGCFSVKTNRYLQTIIKTR